MLYLTPMVGNMGGPELLIVLLLVIVAIVFIVRKVSKK